MRGYTAPVRFALAMPLHGSLQLDIYGELMDSVYLYNKYGEPISYDGWQSLSGASWTGFAKTGSSRTKAFGKCAAGAGVPALAG